MLLKPLEFSDCLADSPWFKQSLYEHEQALESAYKNIKDMEARCRELIDCAKKLSIAQRGFAKSLRDFKIETVGTTQTDDERVIANCLKEFARVICSIEEQRDSIIEEAEKQYIEPLKRFRCDRIGKLLHEEKDKYKKESTRFYNSLEKHLHLSTVKKHDFGEADAQLDMQKQNFHKASLQYVTEIQSVQERMKFEFVETLSSFIYKWLSFYHIGWVTHKDFEPCFDNVQGKVHKAKESFEATQIEANELKEKMLTAHNKNAIFQSAVDSSSIKQGYMYMQDKSKIAKTISRDVLTRNWTKYYCVYQKETRIFTMIPDIKGALGQSTAFKLKACTRRASDSIDKRFCFDLTTDDRPETTLTLQALSEEDRRQWLDAMDGREPVYSPGQGPTANSFETQLDDAGFDFVNACISAIEEKGLLEQGLYRNCGVTSKVQKLMQLALDKRKSSTERPNFRDDNEWETKTISSALKTFLRNLPEPLMTYDLHMQFMNAAKLDDKKERVGHIHFYVYKLPSAHFKMLNVVIRHLRRVADKADENLMTVGNLGVCFGPTLLRPKEETMAAIIDIKFCNVVVEVLIANYDQIFNNKPPQLAGMPCPPKPQHHLQRVIAMPAAAILGESGLDAALRPGIIEPRNHPVDNGGGLGGALRPRSIIVPQRQPLPQPPPQQAKQGLMMQQQLPHIYDQVPAIIHANQRGDENAVIPPGLVPAFPSVATSSSSSSAISSTAAAAGGAGGGAGSPSLPAHQLRRGKKKPSSKTYFPAQTTAVSAGGGGAVAIAPAAAAQLRARPAGDSSDSLNSLGSSDSPSPNGRTTVGHGGSAGQLATVGVGSNALTGSVNRQNRGRMTASYAPAYNPFASDLHPITAAGSNPAVPSYYQQQMTGAGHVSPLFSLMIHPNVQPRRVKTLYACAAGHETELSFAPGQIITNVHDSKEEGWLVGTLNGKTGLIPANYVETLP